MKIIGDLNEQVKRSHDIYKQAMGQAKAIEDEDEDDNPNEFETIESKEKQELIQQILPELVPSKEIVKCRSCAESPSTSSSSPDVSACTFRYCSSACESVSWSRGHKLLCSSVDSTKIDHFLHNRNVARNPDAQIAARIMARFVCEVQQQQQQHASDGTTLSHSQVGAIWRSLTTFHSEPWSLVLANQAITNQTGEEVSLEIVHECARLLRVKDDEAIRANGVIIEPSTPTTDHATEPPAFSEDELVNLETLTNTQIAYRNALNEGFQHLRSSLLASHSSAPSSVSNSTSLPHSQSTAVWLPYISLEHFDRLAGTNRLNCTLTQTTLPLNEQHYQLTGIQSQSSASSTSTKELNLLTANTETMNLDSSPSSSSSTSPPFIIDCLMSVFRPMSLPLANAKGLFLYHSKLNHSCHSNASVENGQSEGDIDERTIEWAMKSQRLVEEAEAQRKREASLVGKGNKKKRQKNRKEAQAKADKLKKLEQLQVERLKQIVQQTQSTTKSVSSASSSSSPSPSSSLLSIASPHTAQIRLVASRSIEVGEEICINYLPHSHEFHRREARQAYLRQHYLFQCHCSLCQSK